MSGGGGDNEIEETESERALADVSIQRWNDYQRRFVPLENRLFGEVRTTEGEMQQGLGRAAAATEQQFAPAREQLRENLFQRGFSPNSGGYLANMAGLKRDESLAGGMNQVGMANALDTQELAGLQGLVSIGRGQSTNAFNDFGQQATSANRQAINDATQALNERLSDKAAVGSAIGTGLGMATAYGLGGQSGSGLTVSPGPKSYNGDYLLR